MKKEFLGKLRMIVERVQQISLIKALEIQNLTDVYNQLKEIVPDISGQYSNFKISSNYLMINVRALHSFQISLAIRALEMFRERFPSNEICIADIGDSAGTHVRYLKYLFPTINAVSVNLDPCAVEKIRKQGLNAILARAEDVSIDCDIFLSYEMIEHLSDPVSFLRRLSTSNNEKQLFVVTVPYLKESRVGLHHIRRGEKKNVNAENTHIFELSPQDWSLLFQHAGWEIVHEEIYLQYPRRGFWRLTQPLWRKLDFEGFYGVIMRRNSKWSECYQDWSL